MTPPDDTSLQKDRQRSHLLAGSPVEFRSPAKRRKTGGPELSSRHGDGWQELIPELMDRILTISARPSVKNIHKTSRGWRQAALESTRSYTPSQLTNLSVCFPRVESLDLCRLRPGACDGVCVSSALSGLCSLRSLAIGEDICSRLTDTTAALPGNLQTVSITCGHALPDRLAAKLGQLGSLASLSLAGCPRLTTEWLATLWSGSGASGLRTLDLSGCSALADRNSSPWTMQPLLSGLKGLHSLKMDGLGFCLPFSICRGLTGLRALSLEATNLPGLDSVVPGLSSLTSLNVAKNPTLGSLSALAPLAGSLLELNLSECLLEDTDLHGLPCLPHLRALSMTGHRCSGELAHILSRRTPGLQTLHAGGSSGEEWTSEQAERLAELPGLSELSIDSAAVATGLSMRALVGAATGVRCLSLSGGCVSNGRLAALRDMVGLESLKICHSDMTYAAGSLSGLTALTSLELIGCSGALPAICCMGGLSRLQALRLSRCLGANHPSLGPVLAMFLPRLARLSVEHCQLTDSAATSLAACCLLTELSLAGNCAVSGHSLAGVLGALRQLSLLDVSGLSHRSVQLAKSAVHPNAAEVVSRPTSSAPTGLL